MADFNAIFGQNKIKGRFPEEIDEDLAEKIGKAIVCFLNCKKVVVGRSGEKESGKISKVVISGLVEQGANVKDLGDADALAVRKEMDVEKGDAGVIVSAEKSVVEIEILKNNAEFLNEENGLKEIRALVERGLFTECKDKGEVE